MGFQKNKKPTFNELILKTKKESLNVDRSDHFVISFADFDNQQSDSFEDWQDKGLLANALATLSGYCKASLESQLRTDKFTHYGNFPPKGHTKFQAPSYITEDANWARIHVNGKSIIAGHYLKNKFYVVFLTDEHNFYLTQRDRAKKDQ